MFMLKYLPTLKGESKKVSNLNIFIEVHDW